MIEDRKTTAILVDSACDLPGEFIAQNDVFVIPVNIEFGSKKFKDERGEKETIRFYRKYNKRRDAHTESRPATPDQIRNLVLKHIAPNFEQMLFICISSTRSETYNNALEAKEELDIVLRGVRDKKLLKLQNIEVFDSLNVFSGQAVIAYCANNIMQIKPDLSIEGLVAGCDKITPRVKTHVILRDLYFAKNKGKSRNEKSIGTAEYMLGTSLDIKPILCIQSGETTQVGKARGFDNALRKLFSIAKDDVSTGLQVPVIVLSYAGSLDKFTKKSAFKEFAEFAENKEISLQLSIMSMTAGIYVGPGAISMSYCL